MATSCQGAGVTTEPMDIAQHLIDHHGWTQTATVHPHLRDCLAENHDRLHEDETAVHLDHDHERSDA